MAVTYLTTGSAAECFAGTTLSVPEGSGDGADDGDLLIFYAWGRPSSGTDWGLEFGAGAVNTIHIRDNGSVDIVAMHLGWKIASGEPSSYTFVWPASTGTNGRAGGVFRLSGHDPDNPINANAEAVINDPSAPFEVPSPSVTTDRPDTMILRFVSGQGAGWTTDGAEISYSGPQASFERLDRACGVNGGGLEQESSLFATPGATGVGTFTIAASGTVLASASTIAIAAPLAAVEFMARHHFMRRRLH